MKVFGAVGFPMAIDSEEMRSSAAVRTPRSYTICVLHKLNGDYGRRAPQLGARALTCQRTTLVMECERSDFTIQKRAIPSARFSREDAGRRRIYIRTCATRGENWMSVFILSPVSDTHCFAKLCLILCVSVLSLLAVELRTKASHVLT